MKAGSGEWAVGNDWGWDRRAQITSKHTGGANFVRGDGSVVFVSNTVNITTYHRLFTIADGSVLGEY
jgi:prepilin-type processing-associated H-X9-DG protein